MERVDHQPQPECGGMNKPEPRPPRAEHGADLPGVPEGPVLSNHLVDSLQTLALGHSQWLQKRSARETAEITTDTSVTLSESSSQIASKIRAFVARLPFKSSGLIDIFSVPPPEGPASNPKE